MSGVNYFAKTRCSYVLNDKAGYVSRCHGGAVNLRANDLVEISEEVALRTRIFATYVSHALRNEEDGSGRYLLRVATGIQGCPPVKHRLDSAIYGQLQSRCCEGDIVGSRRNRITT